MGGRQRSSQRPGGEHALLAYATADPRRAVLDLATSLPPYLLLVAAMLALVDRAYPLVLLLSFPAAGFMTRTFLIMHDCAHGSFLPGRRANRWLGTAIGLLTLQTFPCWRADHILHHSAGGNLASNGKGDIRILSVQEFRALPRWERALYRLDHNPFVVFGLGSFLVNMLTPRLPLPSDRPRQRLVKLVFDVILAAMLVGLCRLAGTREVVLGLLPMAYLASVWGGWLIWVQHRFEDARWQRSPDWDWETAALAGSSHLALPPILRYFSLNIGLHHVHHLNPRIPNYKLASANEENEFLRRVPELSLRAGLAAVWLSLYDNERDRMVTFAQARDSLRPAAGVARLS